MKSTTRLRKLMDQGPVIVPGSWDALSARMVEKLGYEAVYMSGWGVSTSSLGRADLTYITQTEMLGAAQRIIEVVDIPLVADIDDGFGHVLHVQRTIERCQKIGVAAVQLEDMAAPKKCVNVGGARLVPAEEMVKKIEASLAVRTDSDFIIIARTDNHDGTEELFRRAKLYAEAGADVVCFSGDKLVSASQAGIIVGKKKQIDLLKKHPLARALRCGKLTYAVLERTLQLFLDEEWVVKEHALFQLLLEPLVVGLLVSLVQLHVLRPEARRHETDERYPALRQNAEAGHGSQWLAGRHHALPCDYIGATRGKVR